MPQPTTIIETLAGQFFRVKAFADPALDHIWEGVEVKRTKDGFVDKKNARPFSVRKLGTRLVAQQAAGAMVPQPCQQQQAQAASAPAPVWIETSATRRDLTGAQGVILGSVIKLYGRWDAEFVDTKGHSPNLRRHLGRHETEAQARAAVQIEMRLAAIRKAAPPTHIVRFTIPRDGSAPEDILAETRVGDTAAAVVEYLGTGQLDAYVLTEVYAADLTPGAESLTDVTAAILRDVAAYVEAAAIELPRSLDDAFARHGIPQPTAWVEAGSRAPDFEGERLGPADCLDRRRAA